MTSGFFNLSATNVAQRLSSTDKTFNQAIIWGYSSFSTGIPTDNSQPIYLGTETGKLPIKVAVGTPFSLSLTDKDTQDNISNWYAAGTSGDGVCFYAW